MGREGGWTIKNDGIQGKPLGRRWQDEVYRNADRRMINKNKKSRRKRQ